MLKTMFFLLLLSVLIGSALAVINSKYHSRMLFLAIQKMENKRDQYEVEWGQLQLEMTTLIEHGRVERIARQKLGMIDPVREQIVHVIP